MSIRRIVLVVVPMLGLAGSLVYLFATIDIRKSLHAISRAEPAWLLAALGVTLFLLLLSGVRLWSLLFTAGRPVPFRKCQSAVLAATTLNAVIPGRGGDMIKALFLTRQGSEVRALVGVMLVERGIDVLVLGAISMFAAAFGERWNLCCFSGAVVLAALAGLITLALTHRGLKLPLLKQEVGHAAHTMLSRPRRTVLAIFISAFFWLINVGLFLCLFRAVGADVNPTQAAAAAPLALLTGALPISISGMGTRDAAMVTLLKSHADETAVLAATFLYTIVANWLPALIGLFSLGTHTLGALRAAAALRAEEQSPDSADSPSGA